MGDQRSTTNGSGGRRKTPENAAWGNMKDRCYNPNCSVYEQYGGRGIRVCDSWLESFQAFLHDMGERPSPQHSLERIDNDGDYSPENCKWATRSEQTNNTRRSIRVGTSGDHKTITELAEANGMSYAALYGRVKVMGWPLDEALSTPIKKRRPRTSVDLMVSPKAAAFRGWILKEMKKMGMEKSSALHRAMTKDGFIVSSGSIYNHMRGSGFPSPRSLADYEKFFGSKYTGEGG